MLLLIVNIFNIDFTFAFFTACFSYSKEIVHYFDILTFLSFLQKKLYNTIHSTIPNQKTISPNWEIS